MILIGMVTTTTYAYVKSSPATIYELGDELRHESVSIIDYGIYNEVEKIEHFIEETYPEYFLRKTTDTEFSFVYGDDTQAKEIRYNAVSRGQIGLGTTGIDNLQSIVEPRQASIDSGKVKMIILDKEYDFELKPGENFYFVIGHREGDEVFVEKSTGNTKVNGGNI